ncbi:hypothetical protein OHR68_41935 [Spirillospora sp. NBC_00431]
MIADRLKIRGAAVVGHDFGAAVAIQYASQFPPRHRTPRLPRPAAARAAVDAATYRTLSWHIALELYRALDKTSATTAAAGAPTLLMTAQEQLDAIRATVSPRMTKILRAVDVPRAGHSLAEENPRFVIAELLRFLKG